MEKLHHAKTSSTEHIRSNPPRQLNVAEASLYIGISQRYLRSLIAERNIPVVRIGGRVVLRRCDVDRFLEKHLEGSVL